MLRHFKTKRHNNASMMLLLLLAAGALFAFYVIQSKTVWTTDEPISLSLANQQANNGWVIFNKPCWVEKQDWLGFFVTSRPFDYRQVWINQTHDTHPVLFYAVIHTMYSLFPYSESSLPALLPNLAYFLVSAWAVYDIVQQLTEKESYALIAAGCCLFNPVVLNTMQLVRMYCLAQMILTLFTDVCVRILKNESLHRMRNLISLGVLTALGALTHYYCYLYILLMCLLCLVHLLRSGRRKQIWHYAATVTAGFLCSFLIFPGVREHFYSSAHVKIAEANMENGIAFKIGRVMEFWKGNPFGSVLLALLTIMILAAFLAAMHRKSAVLHDPCTQILGGLLLSILAYFLLIASSATFVEHRYIAPIDSILIACITASCGLLLEPLLPNARHTALLAACIAAAACWPLLRGISPIPYSRSGIQYSQKNKEKTCVVMTRHKVYGYWINNLLFELKNYQRTYLAETDSAPADSDHTEKIKAGTVVYLYQDIDQQEALRWLHRWTGITTLQSVPQAETENFTIYLAQ